MKTNNNSWINRQFQTLKTKSSNFYQRRLITKDKRVILYGKMGGFLGLVLKYFLLYALAFIILYPLIQQFAVALRHPKDINDPLVLWIPNEFSLLNFKVAFIVLDYGKSLLNSLVLSIGVTLLQLFVCALAGYSFARLKFKGQKLLFGLVLATIVIAPTTIELPLKNSLINFLGTGKNLIGKPFVLYMFAFLGLGVKAGIFIYLFRQFFKNVPKELEESAYIDGCNPIQTFFRVMLPNAKGAIILTVILTFVWTWNDTYYISNFVTTANFDFNTLTTKIMGVRNSIVYALQTANVWQLFDSNVNENPLFTSMILNTAAILTMIPLIIIYFLVQKALFTEGVERSGIVG